MATISRLSVSLTANTKRFKKGMRSAGRTLKGFVGSVFNVKTAIIGLVGAAGIGLMAKNIITVNARIQRFVFEYQLMSVCLYQYFQAADHDHQPSIV